MEEISSNKVYMQSEDIVAREIMDELIIVPLVTGIGDMDDELFTLNDSGRAIWNQLNGKASLKSIVLALSNEFDSPINEIEKDVFGFVEELVKRRMLIEVKPV